jgi:Macrocin-O-methyltransferase (TylF)
VHQTTKKRFAAILWPRFSHTIEHLNHNANLIRWIDTHTGQVSKFRHRFDLYAGIQAQCGDIPISYLEFGVWRGESLRKWAEINSHPDSRFYGFDSFEGLPEPMYHGFGRTTGTDRLDLFGKVPTFADARIVPIKGWFQKTLPHFLRETDVRHPIIVNNDSDLYSSTIYTLATLDPVLKMGDMIIFDEFASPANEFRAWTEYLNAFMRRAECIGMSDKWLQTAFRIE